MAFINWTDELSVGVVALDDDHKKMIAMINELYEGILEGRDKGSQIALLDRLLESILGHFAAEEALLVETEYLDAEIHAREHHESAVWAKNAIGQFKNANLPDLTLDGMTYIKDWLLDHIVDSDKFYGPFLNSKGIF